MGWFELGKLCKITYTYDENNNMIEELSQSRNGSGWVDYWRITYTYDVNNNMIEDLVQDWDGSNWVNARRTIYTYQSITKIEQLDRSH